MDIVAKLSDVLSLPRGRGEGDVQARRYGFRPDETPVFPGQGFRVAYVDVDVHHGDGVQAAFYDIDQVLTISLHQAGILFYLGTGFAEELGEGAGYGYSINLPFMIYTDEDLYLWAFRQVVPPLVRALFDVYHWDVAYGGIDMGYESPGIILEQATPEEKRQVAGWVRAAMPAGESWSDDYHRQVYGGFLLSLEKDQMDDKAFLRVCRETKRWRDLVDRLLALGRAEEAVATAREVGDYELLWLADIFVSHDHADLAEELIRERSPTDRDSRLTGWLKERARERGDLTEALALAETLFWQRPTVTGYQELRDLARLLERWDELRTATLARLADDEQYRLLTEIHLEEGEVDQALEAVEQVRGSPWGWGGGQLSIRVAQAAEESRPRAAIRIYVERTERLIAARGRGNYAEAAGYLVRVRELYHRLRETATWDTLITDLREQNRRLPALRDELNKAGL